MSWGGANIKNTLITRADASVNIGTGHVMRCLALAHAWRNVGGEAIFAVASNAPVIESQLSAEGFDVERISADPGSDEDAMLTCDLALSQSASFIVVDGYHFSSMYQASIKNAGQGLLFVDDYGHAGRYCADLILNQNIYASEDIYSKREPYTRLLLGSPYVLLRSEFWPCRSWHREISEAAHKVLITLGGSDPDNVTLKTIDSLKQLEIERLEVTVVVGGSNYHYDEIKSALENSKVPFQLVQNTSNMPEVMDWADMAISSGGTTSWELAFMGVPTLIIVLADNQVQVAEKLAKAGIAVNLGWHNRISEQAIGRAVISLLSDPISRASMARVGQRLVDGFGPIRVIKFLLERIIYLMEAYEEDCELFYKWANDPDVRAASFSTDSIAWDEHVKWFREKLQDPNCAFHIVMDSKCRLLGQVRFELNDENAVINISIRSEFRGQRIGSLLILRAVDELFKRKHISRVDAFIKLQNIRSIREFEKAGFSRIGRKIVRGIEALHYIKTRELSFEATD